MPIIYVFFVWTKIQIPERSAGCMKDLESAGDFLYFLSWALRGCDLFGFHLQRVTLNHETTSPHAFENRLGPKKETYLKQPWICSCETLVLGRVWICLFNGLQNYRFWKQLVTTETNRSAYVICIRNTYIYNMCIYVPHCFVLCLSAYIFDIMFNLHCLHSMIHLPDQAVRSNTTEGTKSNSRS